MLRKLLIATVATAPLIGCPVAAWAEKEVASSTRTAPIATSTASDGVADDVTITTDGAITPTVSGAIVTLDSDNTVTNNGSLATTDISDSVGVLVLGGHSGTLLNSGAINLLEDYTATDDDDDGDYDGVFATGARRYGVRITGPEAFTGSIANDSAGSISLEGVDSYGISLETQLVGTLVNEGSISVYGDRGFGVRTTGVINGGATLDGSISVVGQGSVGVAIDADINGALVLQGSVSATGYRSTTHLTDPDDVALLDADDILQGGSAVRVTANVTGGVLLDAPPTDTNDDTSDDEDGDGVTDSSEGTASVIVYGGAPALQIGADSGAITLGAVGTGDDAYGLIIKGAVSAYGVNDGVAATALQLGGGGDVLVTGGVRLSGSLYAAAYEANATALQLKSGATADTLWNTGSISANSISEGLFDTRGLVIDAGATLTTLTNAGAISAVVSGEAGDAYAVLDLSGTLTQLTNTGQITASIVATDDDYDTDDSNTDASDETVTGKAVAIDLRKNTTGVTILQTGVNDGDDGADGVADTDTDGDGVDDADEPYIIGKVLLGSGDDKVSILNGSLIGALSFGDGADSLRIDGGASVYTALTDSDGRLDIAVDSGTLVLTNAETIKATSLTLGAASKLVFAVDPDAGTATKLSVGAASIATGANIGLVFNNLLTRQTTFTVIEAQSLTAGAIAQDLLGDAPYLYVAQAYSDANNVYVDVRRRTAAEADLSRSETSAYEAVFSALSANDDIAGAFLAQNTRDGFLNLYDQMLPSQGEGMFAALQALNQQTSAATAVRPDGAQRYGPDSIWMQEINTLVRRDAGDTQASDTKALGFVAGYEAMGEAGGALGLTLAVVSIDEKDYAAKVGENTNTSLVQAGAYWRRSAGGWRFNLGAGAGYGWFTGDRRFISEDADSDGVADVIVANSADWTGLTASAFAGLGYEAKLGRFYARPEARLDYVWLKEGGRTETGGGDGFDLIIDGRQSSALSGEVAVAVGATFGQALWWRPEVRVGYRQGLAGQIGDTVAHFNGGTPFTLVASPEADAVTLGLALRAGTAMSYVALEGGVDVARRQKSYRLKMTGRAMF